MEQSPEEKAKSINDRFTQGYICACAVLVSHTGNADSTEVVDLVRGAYKSIKQIRNAGVDEHDIEILMPAFKEINRKRRLNKQ